MKLELRRSTVTTPAARDAKRSWPERQSLLLRLLDDSGSVGLGEASPLPGYSPDTLEQAEAALSAVVPRFLTQALERGPVREALSAVAELVPAERPAARMGLETAALDWLARRAGVSAPELLGAAPDGSRPLAQLLGPAAQPALPELALAAVAAGFRDLKLKLGGGAQLELELSAITQLRQRLGAQIRLRLDANGALTEHELTRAWPELERAGIELFEEPGAVPTSLREQLPLALDESLQGASAEEVESLLLERRPRCVVLKPMALGGLSHCWQLAELATRLGVAFVLSHSFDGVLAWRATAALALALPPSLAHGLAPHAGMADVPDSELPVRAGSLSAWKELGLGRTMPAGAT
ncbi:MAG TPA: enolase C-terminal domain-like protein [Polyangiaceae bacterium]